MSPLTRCRLVVLASTSCQTRCAIAPTLWQIPNHTQRNNRIQVGFVAGSSSRRCCLRLQMFQILCANWSRQTAHEFRGQSPNFAVALHFARKLQLANSLPSTRANQRKFCHIPRLHDVSKSGSGLFTPPLHFLPNTSLIVACNPLTKHSQYGIAGHLKEFNVKVGAGQKLRITSPPSSNSDLIALCQFSLGFTILGSIERSAKRPFPAQTNPSARPFMLRSQPNLLTQRQTPAPPAGRVAVSNPY